YRDHSRGERGSSPGRSGRGSRKDAKGEERGKAVRVGQARRGSRRGDGVAKASAPQLRRPAAGSTAWAPILPFAPLREPVPPGAAQAVAKSAITAGAAVSKPTTSSIPASFGSAMLNPFGTMPTTISFAARPVRSRYWRSAWTGWIFPAHVSESV